VGRRSWVMVFPSNLPADIAAASHVPRGCGIRPSVDIACTAGFAAGVSSVPASSRGSPSRAVFNRHCSAFLVAGEGADSFVMLYRPEFLCFTRELSIVVATGHPPDHGDGQLLWSIPPLLPQSQCRSIRPTRRCSSPAHRWGEYSYEGVAAAFAPVCGRRYPY